MLFLLQLFAIVNISYGYTTPISNIAKHPSKIKSQETVHQLPISSRNNNAHSTTTTTNTRTVLKAGLRDLVGPYDDLEYGGAPPGPYLRDSIREEPRNNINGGGFGRRNSPGFVGFRGEQRPFSDINYPNYNVDFDRPPPPSRQGGGRARIFDNVDGGSTTRRINSQRSFGNRDRDPYDRGLDSNFINTNGSSGGSRRRRDTRGIRRRSQEFDDFDDDFDRIPRGGNRGGGGGLIPYRPDFQSFNSLTAVEQYFEAWNRRNIPLALSCFDDNIYYDDTQFSEPFEGKDRLADHLLYVSDCLPDNFYYVIDELSVGRAERGNSRGRRRDRINTPTFQLGRNRVDRVSRRAYDAPMTSIGVLWHIENEYGNLPFARGCSFFKVDPNTNLIVEGYDFNEPAVLKTGSSGLKILSLTTKIINDPKRWLPFVAWIAYVYVVYFSNGIFAWSFMYLGFLSDKRSGTGPYGKITDSRYLLRMLENQEEVLDNGIVLVPPVALTKRNLIGLVPTIWGMQFFSSAFLLPYLFARTSERYTTARDLVSDPRDRGFVRRIRPLYKEELDKNAMVLGEWRGLGVLLGGIGLFALYWGFCGRPEDFGPPIWVSDKRMVDFMKLLDKDRVAASFVLDLWVYGIFQGWLIDDDWKRRGRSLEEEKFLRNVAKFFPFFGMAAYLIWRPQFPSNREEFNYEQWFSSRRGRYRPEDDFEDFDRDRFDDGGFFR